jgi:phosphoribosylpyrophosphate synthetase
MPPNKGWLNHGNLRPLGLSSHKESSMSAGIFTAAAGSIECKTLCREGAPITIYYVGTYRPSKKLLPKEQGTNTQMILALQEGTRPGTAAAIHHFLEKLDKMLSDEILIVMIPSHDPQALPSGLSQLIQRLVTNNRINAGTSLVRHTLVPSLRGDRSIEKHLKSIKVMHRSVIENKTVLLLDDAVTTGNSMRACKKILMENGAAEVVCLTLGMT